MKEHGKKASGRIFEETHKNRWKRYILLGMAGLVVLGVVAAACSGGGEPFRMHILANSDSTADQAVKLKVRDAILEAVGEDMRACGSMEDAEAFARAHTDMLEQVAERVLRENGMEYGAKAYIGVFDFPTRTYGEKTYPAGRYHAARIVLGDGGGQNWWCVMFPPLCMVDVQELPEDGVEFRSALLDWLSDIF